MDLLLDFETFSSVPITGQQSVGAYRYTRDPQFKPLCLYYKEFDPATWQVGPTLGWTFLHNEVPDLSGYDYYWAFNVGFDLNVHLATQIFNMPIDINKWKEVQVVLSKFSLPQNLEDAANVLNTPIKKQADGKLIISRCCKPQSKEPTMEDYNKLFLYCEQDVDATLEVLKACPSMKIPEIEWFLWRETFKMNQRGLPIDFPAVEKIKERVDAYKEVICESLPEMTNGIVTKPTQTKRIKDYLVSKGIKISDCTADTLEAEIEKDDKNPGYLPYDCRQLIEARQAGGASSVAKFDKLLKMRVPGEDLNHDFIRYGATNTLRWAGAGFQVHSLPKKSVKDPEELIERFMSLGHIDNPMQSAKALCRSVIKAPPGQKIYQGDFSSIEYVLLIWITDMTDKLALFKEGKSAYIDMAANLFNKKYEEIDKYAIDNLEYFLGKQVILGCGYQMGAPKFQATCAKYGADIPLEQAKFAVNTYRRVYKPIKQLWKKVHDCCVAAIQNYTHAYKAYKCEFQVLPDKRGTRWLTITLPSNTKLFYHSPSIKKGKYGWEVRHLGLVNYKWTRRYLTPGRITENIVQKLARELMAHSIVQVAKDEIFQLLMTVHDELVALGPAGNSERITHERLLDLMVGNLPPWAKTIPLRAGGFYGPRYKKD